MKLELFCVMQCGRKVLFFPKISSLKLWCIRGEGYDINAMIIIGFVIVLLHNNSLQVIKSA